MTQVFRAPQAVYLTETEQRIQGPATIVVSDGLIEEVIPGTSAAAPRGAKEHVLGDEEVLIPGLVDTHVHVNEPGRSEWEGFATATRAAAAGGVTTLIDMPLNSIPSTTTVAALHEKEAAARDKVAINVGFWGGAVPDNLGTGELRALWDRGVFGFKSFLLHSGVDEFPPLSPAQLRQAMAEISRFDGLIIVHAEDADTIAEAEAHHQATEDYATFVASRPAEAEVRAIDTVIEAAEATGCRAHILHLSAAEGLERIARAQQRGVRITAETCPHYLSLFAEEIPNGATQAKCCPPVRGASNREQLWKGLVDGLIEFVVTDHSPCTPELKKFQDAARTGGLSALNTPGLDFGGPHTASSFGEAWGGISSVQLGLPVVWSEARKRGRTLADVVGWMSEAPARWCGLTDRGAIAPGRQADFATVCADSAFVVQPHLLYHRNKVSAYQERALAGVITRTWVGGKTVFHQGHFSSFTPPFTRRPSATSRKERS